MTNNTQISQLEQSGVSYLALAKKIQGYLGIKELPKYFIDDNKKGINTAEKSDDEVTLQHFNEDSLYSIRTVRFLKDWYRYEAKPDMATRNGSFLRTAAIFKKQGIKNYAFLLQLNNPMLVGVDPRQEDLLTNEQKVWISAESRENFWYFLREVLHLKKDQPFIANRGNISFIWTYLNHITTYNIMPRQQGKAQPTDSKVKVKRSGKYGSVWTKIGLLKTGDTIISPDGSEALVNGTHFQGTRRTYSVVMSDGRATMACPDHIWRYRTDRECSKNGWSESTTAYFIDLLKNKDYDKDPIEIPLLQPSFNEGNEDKLGYLFGAALTTTKDKNEIYLPKLNNTTLLGLSELIERDYPNRYLLSHDGNGVIIKRNDGGLGIDSTNGIPFNLLDSDTNTRIEVLHGALDNHGVVGEDGVFIRIDNSPSMRNIQYIVRSLGGTARYDEKPRKLVITLPKEIPYFRFREETVPDYENKLFVKSITYSGERPCVCIEVNNDDSTYVTDDFIVTHNTVTIQVINYWLTYVMGRGYKTHLITLKSDNRAQFIEAIKNIRTNMPDFMVNTSYRDKDSGTYLTYRGYGEDAVNVLTVSVPQQGKAAAGNLARGLTVGTTEFDEPSYIEWIEEIINGAGPSTLTEMANMRRMGLPYGLLYITTPNTTLHTSGDYMYKRLQRSTEWRETFFDCFSESHLAHKIIKRSPVDTKAPYLSMVYNYLKLGKNKDWVKQTIDDLGLSLSKAKIDLLLMWVEDGESRLFDDETREALNNCQKETVWSKEYEGCDLYVDFYITQEELIQNCSPGCKDFFVIGVDTSSAINRDACTLVIRSKDTGAVIGVGRYPLAYLDDVSDIIVDLLDSIHNSVLIIERNYAHHMIDRILITLQSLDLDPFKKMYNRIYDQSIKHHREYEEVRKTSVASRTKEFYLKFKEYFGFVTTAVSRGELYRGIQECVLTTGYAAHYDKLINEIINLKIKNDRIDHDEKGHDDLVIAWLLSFWFIKQAANKDHYGYPKGQAFTKSRNLLTLENQPAMEDPQMLEFFERLRARITELTEEYVTTRDNILAARLEYEIDKLAKLLPKNIRRISTIDDVIEQAKMERRQRIIKAKRAA